MWGRREYDVWDIHTDRDRWWVVTSPTNLYSQQDFKSMDGVLSFHIGLMARVMAREERKAPSRPAPRLERTRRQWEQAAEAQNEADEAEVFQAVGMRCRETLVSFAHAMSADEIVPQGGERPKGSDFVHWAELVVDSAATQRHTPLVSEVVSQGCLGLRVMAHARKERHPLRRRPGRRDNRAFPLVVRASD